MPSVLVVEDDPSIRQSLIEVLAEHGYAVRSTADGFGALREVTQSRVDAVVLDLGLPDLDGADALRMIRGISSVPVLVATARDDETEIIALLNAGADDYLVKPFSGGSSSHACPPCCGGPGSFPPPPVRRAPPWPPRPVRWAPSSWASWRWTRAPAPRTW